MKKINSNNELSNADKMLILKFVNDDIPKFQEKLNNVLKENSIKKLHRPFQFWGNNIRKYGLSYCPKSQNETNNPSLLAVIVEKIINIEKELNNTTGTYFIIDSLRNPYEILYFRERYTSFYLMSINTTEDERRKNLDSSDYSKSDVDDLDAKEYPEKRKGIDDSYYTQDIESCIELSDIHIAHSNIHLSLNFELKRQLCHYIALMLHPGLVPPSPEERIMQIAITAKLNSGCISRQVGAVVTNERYSVKSIGWNTVAEGQTPCSLRDFNDLCNNCDLSAYSPFERTDKNFRNVVKKLKDKYKEVNAENLKNDYGLSHPFCFKDLYTIQKDGQKNQVHTRSLHAEENAFLQLAKYGDEGIIGGKLFTTASCCELCAKKAYQLGIRDIYYIDSYPGISLRHIFMAGTKCPSLHLFKGAVGRAYQQLYTPFMPIKDEIEFITEKCIKKLIEQNNNDKQQSERNTETFENKANIIKKRINQQQKNKTNTKSKGKKKSLKKEV